jgi:hypothetical protein
MACLNISRFMSKLPPNARIGTFTPVFPNGRVGTTDCSSFEMGGSIAFAREKNGVSREPVLMALIACKNSLLDCLLFAKIDSFKPHWLGILIFPTKLSSEAVRNAFIFLPNT